MREINVQLVLEPNTSTMIDVWRSVHQELQKQTHSHVPIANRIVFNVGPMSTIALNVKVDIICLHLKDNLEAVFLIVQKVITSIMTIKPPQLFVRNVPLSAVNALAPQNAQVALSKIEL